jgi:tetratricopeptide (TPR) repeat protein
LIAETQGDMVTALRMYQQAVAVLKQTGAKTEYTDAERSLGKAYLREADFVSAKQAFSEALSLDRETGAKTDTALDQVALAELSSAQAEPVDMGTLESVIDQFRQQKITDAEIEAEIVLARDNIRQAKTTEAADILKQATKLSARSYHPTIRFDVALATAQLRTAQHRFDDATRGIQPALQSAEKMGCVRCQLEARLELGEIEIQAENAERGRAQLRDLGDEAGKRGFRLIAEQAAANRK